MSLIGSTGTHAYPLWVVARVFFSFPFFFRPLSRSSSLSVSCHLSTLTAHPHSLPYLTVPDPPFFPLARNTSHPRPPPPPNPQKNLISSFHLTASSPSSFPFLRLRITSSQFLSSPPPSLTTFIAVTASVLTFTHSLKSGRHLIFLPHSFGHPETVTTTLPHLTSLHHLGNRRVFHFAVQFA